MLSNVEDLDGKYKLLEITNLFYKFANTQSSYLKKDSHIAIYQIITN